ncbi:MAG: hypothetical protein M1828_006063 [Chrysothrix sp. TS-e1954]|nr:MAG: hypothetical protein M1828_006063 [Chrysothrix sp. TS-e1954]
MSMSDLDGLLDPAFNHDGSPHERERHHRRSTHRPLSLSPARRLPRPQLAARAYVPLPESQTLLRPPPTSPPPDSPPPVPTRRQPIPLPTSGSPLPSAEASSTTRVTFSDEASPRTRVQLSDQILLDPPAVTQPPTPSTRLARCSRQSSIALPRPVKPSLKIQTKDVHRPAASSIRKSRKTRFRETITALSSSSSGTASSSTTLQGSATPPSTTSRAKSKCASRDATPHPIHHRDSRRLSFFPTPVTPLSSLRFPRTLHDAKRLVRRECHILPRLLRTRDRILLAFVAAMLLLFAGLIGVTARREDVMCRSGNEWVVEGLNAFGPSLVVGGPYTLIVVLLAVSRWGRREIAGCAAGREDASVVEEGRAGDERTRGCCERESAERGGHGDGAGSDDVQQRSWWKRICRRCWSRRGGGRYTGLLYAVAVSLVRVAVSALMANLQWKIVDCGKVTGHDG